MTILEQDVRAFDVAVRAAAGLQVGHRLGHSPEEAHPLCEGQPGRLLPQRAALAELGDDVEPILTLEVLDQPDDPRVGQLPQDRALCHHLLDAAVAHPL